MRIFLLEYVTGGGLPADDAAGLLAEGRAMARALATDLARTPGVEVLTTRDRRLAPFHPAGCHVAEVGGLAEAHAAFDRLAAAADAALVIAPETGGVLAELAGRIEGAGGRLLSPSSAVIRIAADKQATAELLAAAGVPVPRGLRWTGSKASLGRSVSFPAVLKPVDGCGSVGVRWIPSAAELPEVNETAGLRLEEYVPGLAASVAVLCGPAGCLALPACEQRLTVDGRLGYLGGRLPLPAALDERARRLAVAAISELPSPRGYLGVDVVLGASDDGAGDRVIEINPRLTTSYVGLRAAAGTNLAAAMLAVARGEPPDLCFAPAAIEFTAAGDIQGDSHVQGGIRA